MTDVVQMAVSYWHDRLAKFFPKQKTPTSSELEMFEAGYRAALAQIKSDIENEAGDTLWISGGETVVDRIDGYLGEMGEKEKSK